MFCLYRQLFHQTNVNKSLMRQCRLIVSLGRRLQLICISYGVLNMTKFISMYAHVYLDTYKLYISKN